MSTRLQTLLDQHSSIFKEHVTHILSLVKTLLQVRDGACVGRTEEIGSWQDRYGFAHRGAYGCLVPGETHRNHGGCLTFAVCCLVVTAIRRPWLHVEGGEYHWARSENGNASNLYATPASGSHYLPEVAIRPPHMLSVECTLVCADNGCIINVGNIGPITPLANSDR